MFTWFEIEYIVLDNGHSHVHMNFIEQNWPYMSSLWIFFFTLQKSICILIKNCMILLRLSTFYVEILIVANIIFKIINKSHYFFYTLDKTGCKCRPSHRHTVMNFPRFIFSKFGPWRSLYSVFVWSLQWLAAQSRVKVTYTGR